MDHEKSESNTDDEDQNKIKISEISRSNYREVIKESKKATLIAIFANQCHGCQQVEPLLPKIKKALDEEIGSDKVQVVTMDINNEVHFLKNVERTPSFIVHDKRSNNFWELDMEFGKQLTNDERKEAGFYTEEMKQEQRLDEEMDSEGDGDQESKQSVKSQVKRNEDEEIEEIIKVRSINFIKLLTKARF